MRGTPALIGREAELGQLREALASDGGLVLVSGEAGIGKSRLVREAGRLAQSAGRPVVWGRPEEVSRPGPFALVLDLVENIVERAGKSPAAAEGRALVDEILGPASPDGTALEGQPVRRIAARIRGMLAQLGQRPVAIVEDLHAADEASHAVIVHLARSAPDDGHLLLGTFRPEEASASDALGRFLAVVARERLGSDLRLSPLDRKAAIVLVAAGLGERADPADVERIAALAEGVPFFIEELAAARELGGAGAIPETISRAVLARRQGLDAASQQVVSAAALLTGSIDAPVIAEALGIPREEVARALTAAARAGLVEDREGKLVFRHGLVREAIASYLVSVEAQELHRRLAETMERIYAEELAPHAKELARHWYEARGREKAKMYALLAGERALSLAANNDARAAFELALACADERDPPPEALVGLGEVHVREGLGEQAEQLLRRAVTGFISADRIPEAAGALSRIVWLRTNHLAIDASPILDEGLQLTSDTTYERERAKFLTQKAGALVVAEAYEEAVGLLAEANDIGRRSGDHVVRADALDGLAQATDRLRGQAEARNLAVEACSEAVSSGRSDIIARTHNNLAMLLVLHGRPSESLTWLAAAKDVMRGPQATTTAAMFDYAEANARMFLGQPADVQRLVGRREVHWAVWQGWSRGLQAWAVIHEGDRERALALVRDGWNSFGNPFARDAFIKDPSSHPGAAHIFLSELAVRIEDRDVPNPEGITAFDEWHASGAGFGRLNWACLATRVGLIAKDIKRARLSLEDLIDELARYPSPYFEGAAIELQGRLAEEAGDSAAAELLLREAIARFEAMTNLVDQARCARVAAGLGRARRPSDPEIVSLLQRARELAMGAGSALEVRRVESALRAAGVRPRVGRPRKGEEKTKGLSSREEEVAVLVAAGATNGEIASRLFLSERTVQDHITHALRKLSLNGRAGLAAWAAKQGLV